MITHILVTHENPDGDAYGSIAAFFFFLEAIDEKEKTRILMEALPAKSDYLRFPFLEEIEPYMLT